MCRWAAWSGTPIFLQDILSAPEHSLIVQSQNASECKTAINGDGFGVAWYADLPEPGLFRDINPAWSDSNLPSIAAQIRSPLFLAHVRATTGSAISRNNCHPFVVGRWSFMHNGQVGGFDQFRKAADMSIPEAFYNHRKGATDSEALFLNALGHNLDADPIGAMSRAVYEMERLSRERGHTPHMRFSGAFSDGKRLFAMRYASDANAPTLYYKCGSSPSGVMIVSEPLEADTQGWHAVPQGSVCCVEDGEVSIVAMRAADTFRDAA
ncbi:Gamma-glutamyl-hercynylcysteine sulfoxide hydrolase [Ascidiaceihabitans donghaensis]|uniref:Gamma-glutamyl-hercynylcysteine sulfoxide hydrolase n=1 Tax=Ascidiaceihabitans donghaensis TaxID=1510460 RepID=A0A2R8BDM1_9RHOB|nr:class II glutamine amidotransferase [Ascidiaceihabitans donghaensis]SPH21180.1 Gamma-glutamyl-hercynylcysteine sulfoxide hydrolase [Ascidiaceihabitans donghaensis]